MSVQKQNGPVPQEPSPLKQYSTNDKDSNIELLQMIPSNNSSQIVAPAESNVVSKLKAQNTHLEKELQNLRLQLKECLERKQAQQALRKGGSVSSSNIYNIARDGSPEGDRILELQKELASVHKEMDSYKKEIKALQLRYSNLPVEKFEEAGNKLSEKQVELKCLELERKTLEKTLKEKNKLLRELQEINEKANYFKEPTSLPVEEELKIIKSKVKEAQKREQNLEKDAQKANQHILKLLDELGRYKDDYRKLLTKTGYDPVEDKIRPVKVAGSPTKGQIHSARPNFNIVLKTKEESEIQSPRMEVNQKNFEKLKDEYREYKKTEAQKQRTFKLKVGRLRENLAEIDREKEETLVKVVDKEKEAGILRNRTRELYRVLLSHGLLPPGKDYEALFRERQNYASPEDLKKKNQNRSLSVGLRKINRKSQRENEGENMGESREIRKLQIKQIQNIRKGETDREERWTPDDRSVGDKSLYQESQSPIIVNDRARGQLVRDIIAKEQPAKQQALKEAPIKAQQVRTQPETIIKEQPQPVKETMVREQTGKDTPVKGQPGKEVTAKEHQMKNVVVPKITKEEIVPIVVTKGMVLKGYRVDDVGHRIEKESEDFNDQHKIGSNFVMITGVRVWHDSDCITGIQAVYQIEDKDAVIEGDEHIIDKGKYKFTELVLQNNDYLKAVSGFTNAEESAIESLSLYSAKGDSLTIGKNKKNSKPFRFDINELEYPAIFHGALRNIKKGKGSVLCRLGVLIRSEAIEEDIDTYADGGNVALGIKKRTLPRDAKLHSPR